MALQHNSPDTNVDIVKPGLTPNKITVNCFIFDITGLRIDFIPNTVGQITNFAEDHSQNAFVRGIRWFQELE